MWPGSGPGQSLGGPGKVPDGGGRQGCTGRPPHHTSANTAKLPLSAVMLVRRLSSYSPWQVTLPLIFRIVGSFIATSVVMRTVHAARAECARLQVSVSPRKSRTETLMSAFEADVSGYAPAP